MVRKLRTAATLSACDMGRMSSGSYCPRGKRNRTGGMSINMPDIKGRSAEIIKGSRNLAALLVNRGDWMRTDLMMSSRLYESYAALVIDRVFLGLYRLIHCPTGVFGMRTGVFGVRRGLVRSNPRWGDLVRTGVKTRLARGVSILNNQNIWIFNVGNQLFERSWPRWTRNWRPAALPASFFSRAAAASCFAAAYFAPLYLM